MTVMSNHALKPEKNSLSQQNYCPIPNKGISQFLASKKIPQSSSNYSSVKTFDLQNWESMANTVNIKVSRK